MSARVIARRHLVARTVRNRRGRDQRPVAGGQRLVGILPAELRRSLRPGVAELQRDLRRVCACARSRRCASTRPRDRGSYSPAQPGLMRASAEGAGHLGEDEAGAAVRAAAEMHEVEVVGRAVDARVLRHRRHHDAVGERDAAQPERREHRRHGRHAGGGMLREPALDSLHEHGVAQAKVLVRDALAAREQAVGELLGLEARVAVDVLEPLGRVARRILDLQDLDRALRLPARERLRADRRAGEATAPARSRPRAPAWCPSPPKNARCARRRP